MTTSTTAHRLAAVALTAATLGGLAAVPATAAGRPHRPDVQISRVQYDSPGRDDRSNRSLNGEWVQITNNTRRATNLDGWTLSDRDHHTYRFHHYRLAGRATVRVHTGIGRDVRTDLYQDRRAYVWNNDTDTATLRNQRGRTVDSISWGHRHR
ncbi:lamin tail domain-containing protein [Streptomyces sp. NPDC052207]|uniref:lamin tail domain-containing protein n=1 Tax=Streptomyces sp. NPDC052207 TaxID=3155418 RepID=UPI003427017C